MGRNRVNRILAGLAITAVVISACTSDDETSSTTVATTEGSPPTTEAGLDGEGLELGLLAPPAGLLASLYVGQERGAALAVEDVNDGGGVLGGALVATTYRAEPGSEPTDVVDLAVDAGAQALVGPAGSSDALEVREQVAALESSTCSASASVPSITRDQDDVVLVRTVLPLSLIHI